MRRMEIGRKELAWAPPQPVHQPGDEDWIEIARATRMWAVDTALLLLTPSQFFFVASRMNHVNYRI
jgi:hypothetical protein